MSNLDLWLQAVATPIIRQNKAKEPTLINAELKKDETEPTREQLGKIAQLVGQVYGLSFAVEQVLRECDGDKLSEDAKLACCSLDDAARYLDHVLRRRYGAVFGPRVASSH